VSDQTSIPGSVRVLVRDSIHSIEQLEVLLCLCRAEPTAQSPDDLAHALGLAPDSCRVALQQLVVRRLAVAAGPDSSSFRYAPASEEQRAAVAALAAYDQAGRVDLMLLISGNAVGRVRRRARRMFNETLRLKKE